MPTAFSRSTDAFRDPSDGGEQILYRFQEAAAQRFLGDAVEGVLATVLSQSGFFESLGVRKSLKC
jgi:hypothetical protein